MAGCAILILAAGASSRMRGADKLLEQVAGQPMLRLMLERALHASSGPVLCTLPAPDHPRMACLDGMDVAAVVVQDAAEGMGASLRAGVRAVPADCSAVMILPGDMPELDAHDLRQMLLTHEAQPKAILRAADKTGQHGHPVIFPADLFGDLRACHGDSGAREVLRRHAKRVVTVPLPDLHATTDLDTPEDWTDWRTGPNASQP